MLSRIFGGAADNTTEAYFTTQQNAQMGSEAKFNVKESHCPVKNQMQVKDILNLVS